VDDWAFIDSVVLIGAFHRRDQHHEHALPILLRADEGAIKPLHLTDFVLAETINFLTRKGGSAMGRDALRRLEASKGFRVERISDAVYHEAKNEVYANVDGLSFVDAVTVAFMRHKRLRWIYSFDDGFDRVDGIDRLAAIP
jgi:uncharacterized protein